MPSITYIQPNGKALTINAPVGQSLMQSAVDGGVEGILGTCGGGCSCGTCHVQIADEWMGRVGRAHCMEKEVLALVDYLAPNSRLSCQIRMTDDLDGLVVSVPGD
jgi:2Fe-2S ferredoxin